ncbi:MAG: hypothetical protein N5P05_002694 [Chroococcopsis gigantea SAG 12.99]|nr:hypothetical protein [Chroococcopsis gigantea SAG 12.99]
MELPEQLKQCYTIILGMQAEKERLEKNLSI